MAYQKKNLEALAHFLPPNTFDAIFIYLSKYNIQLSVTPQRKSIHGNYQYNYQTKQNKISVNGTLNKYSFLITLIHEIAHCICMNQYLGKVAPHGKEWQNIYSDLLLQFSNQNIFPVDVLQQLQKTINSPKASSCADPALEKVLAKYNTNPNSETIFYIEDLQEGENFTTTEGKLFKRLEKRRTRYLCQEIKTGKQFLFPAIYQIKKIDI